MTYKVITSKPKKDPSVLTKSLRLMFLLFLTFSVGYIGGTFVTPKALEWYNGLILSSLNPPPEWFGMAWGILYVCMSFSAWLVWGKTTPRPFVLQLAFNLLWPFLFFYLKNPVLSFIDTLVMIIFIGITAYQFGKVSKIAGGLMIPVLIWSLFALYLNAITVLYNTKIGVSLGLI